MSGGGRIRQRTPLALGHHASCGHGSAPGIIRVLIGFCVGAALMTTGSRPRLLPLAPINHDESTMGLPPQND